MTIPERVREHCAAIAGSARHVSIDLDAADRIEPGSEPVLDPERHYLEGSHEDVASYLLTLDAINFGSGWFPTLRKRPGSSGYHTVAWSLAERFREAGPWTPGELTALDAADVADVLGQDRRHELMALYADALQSLGRFLTGRSVAELLDGSAAQLAETLAAGMPFFDDVGFWKRAQIVKSMKSKIAFTLVSKMYRQMYANTGIATDSARHARASRMARLLARPCRRYFVSPAEA